MKRFFAVFLWLMVFSPAVFAQSLALPEPLQAKAYILRGEWDGLWENTLVIEFPELRRVLSTQDGFLEVQAIINSSADPALWAKACEIFKTDQEVGGKVYLRRMREKPAATLGMPPERVVQLGTAADMDHLAVVTKTYPPFVVTALVTAGAKTNALRAGVDEGAYIEGEEPKGTVILFLLTNAKFSDGAMARALITITEAKTAAFQDLDVPSSYTKNMQETGTGTDGIVIASGGTGPDVTYTGGHSKIGELIGKATHEAVMEALRKQNGFQRKR
jgi:adenosylcobinamide amidohydrolase